MIYPVESSTVLRVDLCEATGDIFLHVLTEDQDGDEEQTVCLLLPEAESLLVALRAAINAHPAHVGHEGGRN